MTATSISTFGTRTAPGLPGLGAAPAHVRAAAEVLAAKAGLTKVGRNFGPSAYEPTGHPLGLAVDFPCTTAQGDALAAYAAANATDLAIKHVIWKQRIWTPAKGWTAMSDRGSATANHFDHVHVSWNAIPAASGWLDRLKDTVSGGVDVVTGAASSAVGSLNPFTNWKSDTLSLILKGAFISGGITLVIVGGLRLVVPATMSSATKLLGAAA